MTRVCFQYHVIGFYTLETNDAKIALIGQLHDLEIKPQPAYSEEQQKVTSLGVREVNLSQSRVKLTIKQKH